MSIGIPLSGAINGGFAYNVARHPGMEHETDKMLYTLHEQQINYFVIF